MHVEKHNLRKKGDNLVDSLGMQTVGILELRALGRPALTNNRASILSCCMIGAVDFTKDQ